MPSSVKITNSALDSVQRARSEVYGGAVGASVLRKRKCVEADERHLLRDGRCFSWDKFSEGVERANAAVTV